MGKFPSSSLRDVQTPTMAILTQRYGQSEHGMTRNKCFVLVSALLLLLIPRSSVAGGKINLRLYGGLNYLSAGDVNSGTRGFFEWGKAYFAPPPGGSINGGYGSIHLGYEFGGDVIFSLSPRIGIGIGTGYERSSKNPPTHPGMMFIYDDPQGYEVVHFYAGTTLSAVPVRFGVFLSFPLGKKLNLTANTGVAYYLKARYRASWFVLDDVPGLADDPFQTLITAANKKSGPFGFHGGLGIEYELLTNAALFVETEGRFARLRGFEGTSAWQQGASGGLFPPFAETGKLYYESVPMIPGSPRLIMVQSAPPAGPGGRPREAVVDFSGVSIRAGIRIRL